MRKLFIPCTLDGLPKHTGSRMIRCEWVAKHWPGAEVFDGTQRLTDFQLFVFQKAYLTEQSVSLIRRLAAWRDDERQAGGLRTKPAISLAFDLCDPDFLDERHRQRMLAVLPLFNFATATTAPLVDWLAQYLPAYLVPDGVDLDAIQVYRGFVDNRPPKIVWMGYKGNSGVLSEIAAAMADSGVTGDMVCVDTPLPFPRFVQQMAEYDILLNPRSTKGKHRYKSDNKTLVAWAAGVAVARNGDELTALLDPDTRRQHIVDGRAYVAGPGNVARAVERWQAICEAEGL